MYWHRGTGIAEMFVMGIVLLLFLALVVGAVLLVVRMSDANRRPVQRPPYGEGPPEPYGGASSGRNTEGPAQASDAARILDERFARGEIDEDEYRRRRDVLRGG